MPDSPEVLFGNPDAFDQEAADQYRDYRMDTDFRYDPGILVLPVATADGSPDVEVVRVHGGFGTRRVKFRAVKSGNPPVLPAAADTDRDMLVGASINMPLPVPDSQNGGYVWAVSGEYMYVTTDTDEGPRIPGIHPFPAGRYPFPLPLQDADAEAQLATTPLPPPISPTDPPPPNDVGLTGLPDVSGDIAGGDYTWPFTTMTSAFFNPLLLRED